MTTEKSSISKLALIKLDRLYINRGHLIYSADSQGYAWRVMAGTVRLDRIEDDGKKVFSGLATAGDIIGAETLLLGHYIFNAQAINDCAIEKWTLAGEKMTTATLLQTLTKSELRMAEVLSLRCGKAAERVYRFLAMIGSASRVLPRLKDIADITGLTIETVSRTLSRLTHDGVVPLPLRKKQDAS